MAWYFRRNSVLESLDRREGQCLACGACCRSGPIPCPFLGQDNRCRVYEQRPTVLCRLPPLDINPAQMDKHRALGCGFHYAEPGDEPPYLPPDRRTRPGC